LQAGVASAGALFGAGGALAPRLGAALPGRATVRLGYVGNPCEAATFAAPNSASFASARLEARLVGYRSDDELIAALGAGTVDAASVTLPALLRPIESGARVRVVAALHAGCLRVLAPNAAELWSFADLKGKAIATDRLHGPAMNLLSALLYRQGIDPARDVSWHVYDASALEPALASKAVDCVAASDPLGYFLIVDKAAEPYVDTADGGFSCGGDIAHGHHCFLVMHAGLVETRPALAASLTRAYLGTSTALVHSVGPAALDEVRGQYVDTDMYATIGMLSSYDWRSSTDLVVEEIELTARDFRRAGLLQRGTDPYRLADRAFADVLHG
jgi:NitT/TauT family transport system substrate-binding protein